MGIFQSLPAVYRPGESAPNSYWDGDWYQHTVLGWIAGGHRYSVQCTDALPDKLVIVNRIKLAKEKADAGDITHCYHMGTFYFFGVNYGRFLEDHSGLFVNQDDKKAFHYYKKFKDHPDSKQHPDMLRFIEQDLKKIAERDAYAAHRIPPELLEINKIISALNSSAIDDKDPV